MATKTGSKQSSAAGCESPAGNPMPFSSPCSPRRNSPPSWARTRPAGRGGEQNVDYIKKNNLQNPQNKREILADDKLEPIFGKKKVTMFEMNKHLAQHLK